MGIFHNIIRIFLVSSILLGCGTTSPTNRDDSLIIKSHVEMYANSVDSQNDDIAAILREFSNKTLKNDYSSWAQLAKDEDLYMLQLTTNYISSNYTVVASSEEIKISDSFLDMIILNDSYYHYDWIYSIDSRMPYICSRFIVEMNDWQYENRQEK